MKPQTLIALTALLLTTAYQSAAQEHKIVFQHCDAGSGIYQRPINGLYQDETGMLWIGTKNGVMRHNGSHIEPFRLYDLDPCSRTNIVQTVCGDKNGHVFLMGDYQIAEYDLKTNRHRIIFTQYDMGKVPSIAFCQGKDRLWIGMADSLFYYRGEKACFHTVLPDSQATITALNEASDGSIWIGTKQSGVFRLHDNMRFDKMLETNSNIFQIYEDSSRNTWIGTFSQGAFCLPASGFPTNYHTAGDPRHRIISNLVRAICEDDDGNIWLGTLDGVEIISHDRRSIRHFGSATGSQPGLSYPSVLSILKDNQGTLWFGTYYGGLNYYNPKIISFEFNDISSDLHDSGYPILGKIVQDKHGNRWMGSETKGLLFCKAGSETWEQYRENNQLPPFHTVKTLLYDAQEDVIWVGTHLYGLYKIDPKLRSSRKFTINPADETKHTEMVNAIEKANGKLYIGTLNGLYCMDLATEQIRPIEQMRPHIIRVRGLRLDRNNRLWIVGSNVCNYDLVSGKILDYQQEISRICANNQVNSLTVFENIEGRIFIGTSGFGILLFDPFKNSFRQYDSRSIGLDNDYVSCFAEIENRLLVGTDSGFSVIDIKDLSCNNYSSENGFPLTSMMCGDIFCTNDGEITLSGFNGVASFRKEELVIAEPIFNLYFSKLWVNNNPIHPQDSTGILKYDIEFTDKITFRHNQVAVMLEIGHDNYVNIGQPLFQYRLQGYDDNWNVFDPRTQIKYVNLPYGRYTLDVRAITRSGTVLKTIHMELYVKPPVYATWYAWLFYSLLAGSLILWAIYFYHSKALLQTSLEYEKQDKIRRERSNQSKLRFFANISHELKTPLTLIIGKLELLLQSEANTGKKRDGIVQIHDIAVKMSELINELMNFQKYEHGKFRLTVQQSDMAAFLNGIYLSFVSMAEIKHIDFKYIREIDQLDLWFDPSQMSKAVNNLLSNAFKYTAEGGCIRLTLRSESGQAIISVSDNGIGFDTKHRRRIFEQFYQEDNTINRAPHQTGTGIGLSLTQSIVKAHAGTLQAESEKDKGSTFTITLPLGRAPFENREMVDIIDHNEPCQTENTCIVISDKDRNFLKDCLEKQTDKTNGNTTILIVEDDTRLREMLIEIFDPIFQVFDADNGQDGLALVKSKMPDLVLSDVVMPGMSGTDLCARIKSDFELCHIPVILITALTSTEDNIKGLMQGADDYITKPFHIRLLVTKCLNILENRKKMQEKFCRQIEFDNIKLIGGTLDQQFIEKAIRIIEEQAEAGQANIPTLCNELAVSRTVLFSKIKGITGKTPHEFIQTVKLKIAARLLIEHYSMNITDITYKLGFSSLNRFGKLFKLHYGESPSEYRKNRAR